MASPGNQHCANCIGTLVPYAFVSVVRLITVEERSTVVYICLSVCASVCEHMSVITRPIFANFFLIVICCRGSILLGGVAICYVLPDLWMTSCLHGFDTAIYT